MATPMKITFTEEDMQERANYDDLEGDYIATLLDVEDVTAQTGNYGWGFKFDVKGLTVTSKVWLKGGGMWKVREVFNALGQPLPPNQTVVDLDPNPLIGNRCVVTIVQDPRDDGQGTWTNISRHTPLVTEDTPSL